MDKSIVRTSPFHSLLPMFSYQEPHVIGPWPHLVFIAEFHSKELNEIICYLRCFENDWNPTTKKSQNETLTWNNYNLVFMSHRDMAPLAAMQSLLKMEVVSQLVPGKVYCLLPVSRLLWPNVSQVPLLQFQQLNDLPLEPLDRHQLFFTSYNLKPLESTYDLINCYFWTWVASVPNVQASWCWPP